MTHIFTIPGEHYDQVGLGLKSFILVNSGKIKPEDRVIFQPEEPTAHRDNEIETYVTAVEFGGEEKLLKKGAQAVCFKLAKSDFDAHADNKGFEKEVKDGE